LIPKSSMLANVSGVLNAILLEGRALGPCLVYGRGAGDLPTAVSVVADILDVAQSIVAGVAGLSTRGIAVAPRPLLPMSEITARVPYGTRSAETVIRYAIGCARVLTARGVKAIVVACNTVSAVALDMLRVELDLPVLGVILPGARAAVAASQGEPVGVLGTTG